MHLSSLYLSISWYIVVVPSICNELISLPGFVPPGAEESPLGVDICRGDQSVLREELYLPRGAETWTQGNASFQK